MIQSILVQMLYSIPEIIVWLVGIVIAIVRWQKHPHLSILVLITFLLFIVFEIASDVLNLMLPQLAYNEHMSYTMLSIFMAIINIILYTPPWALVIWAIFGWRNAAPGIPVMQMQPQWVQSYPQPPLQQWQMQPQPQPQEPQPGQPPQNQG